MNCRDCGAMLLPEVEKNGVCINTAACYARQRKMPNKPSGYCVPCGQVLKSDYAMLAHGIMNPKHYIKIGDEA